ncbi:ribonuclease E/G [Halobacillus seohaensis]|uniref:Ribonuclease E/G n=1 Tax=Halobacillus seohaensis TaxID=447421 RepID=A0ABW2EK36_9BACI
MKTIALHTKMSEMIGLVIEDHQVIEYLAIRPEAEKLAGSIYSGIVRTIHKGMQAAFVDIGTEKHAFLKKDTIPWCNGGIEHSITEGQTIIVQVTKESIGEKGAQVSADPTIPGIFSIYQPFGKRISVSRKIEKERAKKIKNEVAKLLVGEEGSIIRTGASGGDLSTIEEEIIVLREKWRNMKQDKPIGLLWEDQILPDQLIRKYASSCDEIVVDTSLQSQEIKINYPSLRHKVRWVKQIEDYTKVSINLLQDHMTQRRITTDKGVQLVIDMTEAMIVIDVNSFKFKQKALSNEEAFEINKLAANEVARQLKLRNLSGMILVDFISMKSHSLDKQLVQWLGKQVSKDPIKTVVHGVTKLGIIEITRTRQRPSVMDQLLSIQKVNYNLSTQLYRLERELLVNVHNEAVLLVVSPELYDFKKQLHSGTISSRISKELFVRQDPKITDWQIELEGSLDMITAAIQRREYHVDNLF